jgi:hypothetical protein
MSLRFEYENTAPSSATSNTTQYVRLFQDAQLTQHAEEGTVALSSINIDDPDGALDIVGFRRIRAYETTATGSNTLAYNGWVADKSVTRGPFVVGSSRLWAVSMTDQNAVLGYRVMIGADNKRPRENDIQRVNWVLGTAELSVITEHEYVASSAAAMMDAVDYNGQTPMDILNDCAQQSGRNYFVYSKDGGSLGAVPTLGLFYDRASSTAYSSPLRLSNLASDVDGVWTFAISEDTELSRDPSRVYSGAYVQYDGGVVYEQSQTTYVNFTKRDAIVPAPNVKQRSTATNRALRYLADSDTEEDRITTSYYVPASKLNFAREGMRIQFRASHLPNFDSFTWLRILSRTFVQVSEQTDPTYRVTLTLGAGPPAPVTHPASGVLYQPKNGGGGGSMPEVRYEKTGDAPAGGYPVVPLVGSLQYVRDGVGTGFGAPYKGFRALGSGTLTVRFRASDIAGVAGTVTCTPSICLNGAVIASSPHTTNDGGSGFPYGHSQSWDITTVVGVVNGDVVSSQFTSTWGSSMTVPSGTGGNSESLTVSGNLT